MIYLYSKTNCPECVKAAALLDSKNVPYEIVKVDQDAEARNWLLAQGHRSVPQIYYGQELLVAGGYKGLLTLTDENFAALK